MRKLGLFAAAMVAAVSFASAASASGASGNFSISNTASVQVNKVADSFTGVHSFSASIAAGSGGSGTVADTGTGNVYSGTVIYTEPVNGYGCSFTVVVIYSPSTAKYSFSFSSSPQGGLPSTACSITASRNTTTGTFSAFPVISGF